MSKVIRRWRETCPLWKKTDNNDRGDCVTDRAELFLSIRIEHFFVLAISFTGVVDYYYTMLIDYCWRGEEKESKKNEEKSHRMEQGLKRARYSTRLNFVPGRTEIRKKERERERENKKVGVLRLFSSFFYFPWEDRAGQSHRQRLRRRLRRLARRRRRESVHIFTFTKDGVQVFFLAWQTHIQYYV